jgi:hypothetical protein
VLHDARWAASFMYVSGASKLLSSVHPRAASSGAFAESVQLKQQQTSITRAFDRLPKSAQLDGVDATHHPDIISLRKIKCHLMVTNGALGGSRAQALLPSDDQWLKGCQLCHHAPTPLPYIHV